MKRVLLNGKLVLSLFRIYETSGNVAYIKILHSVFVLHIQISKLIIIRLYFIFR